MDEKKNGGSMHVFVPYDAWYTQIHY